MRIAQTNAISKGQSESEVLLRVPKLPWVVLPVIGAVALAIRLTALSRFSYWLDEILEVDRIHAGWARMLRALRAELLNPPLDYIVQKTFNMLGPSDAARRVLPALWGTGCVVAFGILVARRAGPRVGAVTALCLAFAPFHVHYSQEVRPYSLGMFLTVLTLLLLDHYLENPSAPRLVAVLISAVGVAFSLFLAALVLLLAGGSLVLDDALTGSDARRRVARRLLLWSPALLALVAVAYLPWLPVVWRSLAIPPFSTPPVFVFRRVTRLFSYFGFGFHDWYPLGRAGALFIALVVIGSFLAVARYRLRFVFFWGVLGVALTESLEERHGVYDSIFHFLPAGLALTVLATLPIGWLAERRTRAWLAAIALALVLFLDARALKFYFTRGRPDWRPVAAFLRSQPRDQKILTAGVATWLSVGYYVNGPDWACCAGPSARSIIDVGSGAAGLLAAWPREGNAWLVAPVGTTLPDLPALSRTAGALFSTAAEGVRVYKLQSDSNPAISPSAP
jgi:hypothetical protein